MIDLSSMGRGILEWSGILAAAHELRLSLKIRVLAAQAWKTEKPRIGDDSFCVEWARGGKIILHMGETEQHAQKPSLNNTSVSIYMLRSKSHVATTAFVA